jgi:glycosyltransferase involved in cell wall biosynthesis
MRIIAINRFYRPDHSATSQILTDLAEHLAGHGHQLLVITSRLGYAGGPTLAPRERLAGVDVRRIWTTRFGRSRLLGRALDYMTFYPSAFWTLITEGRKGDIVIAKTDPPLISIIAALAARLKGMRLVNWCQDLFPEVAGALGIGWAKGPLGKLLTWMRNRSLQRAIFNAAIHQKMAERLIAEGVPPEKIRVLENWADAGLHPVPHDENPLRNDWGLKGRFVIGYSGNLGRAHLPARIAELVNATRDIPDLTWLFIGGGAGFDQVRQATGGAWNVLFQPYQPRDALSQSLSVPDIHLVVLDPDCEGLMVPSKLYGARAAHRPVLFLGDRDGASARDISSMRGGVTLDITAPETWRQVVEGLVDAWRAGDGLTPGSPAFGALGLGARWINGWSAAMAVEAWSRELAGAAKAPSVAAGAPGAVATS